ncbi:hypothetical protein P3T40_003443 [Paraburkholderia sp. EB58]|jgi:hypothetical protein|uniref:hypothetical protein n=1 Tax=Paraburkholderia sp. EB58 TaxID=3035125 RepID=UPI003D19C851
MIRRASNYINSRPLLGMLLGFAVVFVLLYIAAEWDRADDAALRIQWLSANFRSAT